MSHLYHSTRSTNHNIAMEVTSLLITLCFINVNSISISNENFFQTTNLKKCVYQQLHCSHHIRPSLIPSVQQKTECTKHIEITKTKNQTINRHMYSTRHIQPQHHLGEGIYKRTGHTG